MRVIDQIPGMRPADVADALPSIMKAFENKDDTVKRYAGLALFGIGQRPDGANLLKPYARAIDDGLVLSDPPVQRATVLILTALGPTAFSPDAQLPLEVIPALLDFVKRTDRDPTAQVGAFSFLLRVVPENTEIIPALQAFSSRKLDPQVRTALINGIANSHTENSLAADMLIAALGDPDEQIRFQAAQAFGRMPKHVVMRAKPALEKVIARPDESAEVKSAAQQALKTIGG